MDECGRTLCGGGGLGGLFVLYLLYQLFSLAWDERGRKKNPPVPPQQDPEESLKRAIEEAEKQRWNEQVYEATKLIYGEPNYARVFNRYPDERKRLHIEEVAGYIPELLAVDKFIEKLKQMPMDERSDHQAEAERQVQRKVELLQKVYRKLD
ncbi:hypothetical protein GCM10027292_21340 [Hydrogenophaga aquatica]